MDNLPEIEGDIFKEGGQIEEYSTDASLFKLKPDTVIFPKSSKDVQKIISHVANNDQKELSITARAAGTCMSGGPLSESIVLGFTKYFDQFDIKDHSARVEPGVYYRDFEEATKKKGMIMPSYPASKSLAALGGMINNNAGGEKTLRYGKTNEYVKKMKMVLADGNEYTFEKLSADELEKKKQQDDFEGKIYRETHQLIKDNYELIKEAEPDVSKNSSGYALWNVWSRDTGEFDLTQLFCGAQGTLGIMTEAEMKLVDTKKHSRLAALFLKDFDKLPEIVNDILPLDPESLETFDDETLKLGLKFFPEIAKKVEGMNLPKLLWKFIPEFFIGVKMMGLPKLVVLVQFAEDSIEQIEEKFDQLKQRLESYDIEKRILHSEEEGEKYFTIRRESFNLLRKHVKGKRTAPFVDDFEVQPKHLPKVLPKIREIMEEYDIHSTIAGHSGSGNFHIIPLMDLTKKENRDKIPEVSQKVYDIVLDHNGTITAEHNDGLIRTPYIEKMFGSEMYQLFKEVKNIFDPDNIFNPGKKVNGDLEYAMEHIDEEG
ncbi:MAG: FAD-binding oxidoreductase [Candidatus Magasanikbacteria bacterium]